MEPLGGVRIAVIVMMVACGRGTTGVVANAPVKGADGAEVETLRALAKALKEDDGVALARVVHPTEGAMFWYQHAEMAPPGFRMQRGRPSEQLAMLRGSKYPASYAADVSSAIDAGLGHVERMTRAAPDRCEDKGHTRSRLEVGGDYPLELKHLGGKIADSFGSTVSSTSRFRTWGLEVYLKSDRGGVWVTHVIVWDPCNVSPHIEIPEKNL
jgi:hypothetical protein